MPVSLLTSQLQTLEEPDPSQEHCIVVDGTLPLGRWCCMMIIVIIVVIIIVVVVAISAVLLFLLSDY